MFKRGDIIFVDLGSPPIEVKGHEQGNKRPCVVIKSLDALKLFIVVPITTKEKSFLHYTMVELNSGTGGLKEDSFALCHQIRTISDKRVLKKFGAVASRDLSKIITVLQDTLEI